MPRDKNARVERVGGYCCWIRFFFFSFFPPSSQVFSFFFYSLILGMGLGMEWRFEVFYSRWRADELKFEKVGGRGYIYFKRG